MNRRDFATRCATPALMATAGLLPRRVAAQSFDVVRILAGLPPGGGSENIARCLADRPRGTTLLLTDLGSITLSQFAFNSLPCRPDDTVPVSTQS